MVTGVGLGQFFLPWLNWSTPKTPSLVQKSRTYLLYEPSYSQFSVQITATGYHGNKGRSEENVNYAIRFADPENPQFGANSMHVSSRMPELQLFEVFIGRNAIFHILGKKSRENINCAQGHPVRKEIIAFRPKRGHYRYNATDAVRQEATRYRPVFSVDISEIYRAMSTQCIPLLWGHRVSFTKPPYEHETGLKDFVQPYFFMWTRQCPQ